MKIVSNTKPKIHIFNDNNTEIIDILDEPIGDVYEADPNIIPKNSKYLIEKNGNLVPYEKEVLYSYDKTNGFWENIYSVRYDIAKCINTYRKKKINEYILYKLNINTFTKNHKIKNPSTFDATANNIDYLRMLGINAVEIMPIYEFNPKALLKNVWGYTKQAYYYAPKSTYGICDPIKECKNMIQKFHESNIDVILEMYFNGLDINEIENILAFWIKYYGVDGFRVFGEFDKQKLVNSPYLTGINLFIDYNSSKSNIAKYNDDFKNSVGKFMLSDNAREIVSQMLDNGKVVKYVSNTNGFTLIDSFSYFQKHNEINGEGNRDGENYYFSQNFGYEGKTNNKKINSLRIKAVKNALALNILSSGIPLIYSGDECLRTQDGNNNGYWLDDKKYCLPYKLNKSQKDVFDTVKNLIYIRKEIANKINKDMIVGDFFPKLSIHTHDAWDDKAINQQRYFGILDLRAEPYLLTVNMTYTKQSIGIVDEFIKGMKLKFSTDDKQSLELEENRVVVRPYSVNVYMFDKE